MIRLWLLAGFVFLLYHNVVGHHHHDDEGSVRHYKHHQNDALEHVKVDHHFFQTDQQDVAAISAAIALPNLYIKFELTDPISLLTVPLPQFPDKAPPDTWLSSDILRGPPARC